MTKMDDYCKAEEIKDIWISRMDPETVKLFEETFDRGAPDMVEITKMYGDTVDEKGADAGVEKTIPRRRRKSRWENSSSSIRGSRATTR